MAISSQTSIAEALVPAACLKIINSTEVGFSEQREQQMRAVASLIVNLAQTTVKNIQSGRYHCFDANPGDGGCQLRAFIVRRYVLTVFNEVMDLKDSIKLVDIVLQTRKTKNCCLQQQNLSTAAFFESHILPLKVSQPLLYMIRCLLLTYTKISASKASNGVVTTKNDISKLSCFSPYIHILEKTLREELVNKAAAQVSEESLHIFQENKGDSLTLKMLSIIRQDKPVAPYQPKSFGYLFFQMKSILSNLREEEAVIGIRPILSEGVTSFIFLKFSKAKEELDWIQEKDVSSDHPMIFFAAVLGEKFEEIIKKIEVVRGILMLAALEPPCGPGSTLEDVSNEDARAEIATYREQGEKHHITSLMQLDHVYCNTFKEECKRKSYVVI